MNRRFTAAAVFVLAAGPRLLLAAEPVPLMVLTPQTARVGKPLVLRVDDDSGMARDSDIRVIVRFRGDQELVEPRVDPASKSKTWRFTPRGAGTYVISTSIEPTSASRTDRLFQYEKMIVVVAPDGPVTDVPARPSASAIARFGHRLEIDSMVDPSCLMIGGVLPVRIKFDGKTMKNMELVVACRPTEVLAGAKPVPAAPAGEVGGGPPPDVTRTFKSDTGENDFARIPIRDAGRWILVAEHKPDADGVRIRPGDRFVATLEFRVNRPKAEAGRSENRPADKRGE
ncbi:MAG: DUF4198 domain-containing protein [Planctomycetota bacterium]|nr:DUF4198 domain-containing protein [Planctomycetota bacterium]